jgi:hypothetical protein
VDFGGRGASEAGGAQKFSCRVTPPENGRCVIQIKLDGLDGKPVGYVDVVPGKSEITVKLLQTVTGVHDLVFVFYGQGWEFEQWQFIK